MKKIICAALAILSIVSLASCTVKKDSIETVPNQEWVTNSPVYKNTESYKIYRGDSGREYYYYYYELYDNKGNMVKKECTNTMYPQITELSENLIRVTVQTGTGASKVKTYFYNRAQNVMSQTFDYALCDDGVRIAYYNGTTIVIRNIFDPNGYWQEISTPEVSKDSENPITSATFSLERQSVEYTYKADGTTKTVSKKLSQN